MKLEPTTPTTAMLLELGRRLATVRAQQGLTQQQLAEQAGIGIATLRRIEDGKDGRLGSWLRLLTALQLTAAIDAWLPEDVRSPLLEVKGRRRRVRKPRPTSPAAGDFVWGDQRP